jgi:hypothetical protein
MIEWASGDVTSLFSLCDAQRRVASATMAKKGAPPISLQGYFAHQNPPPV